MIEPRRSNDGVFQALARALTYLGFITIAVVAAFIVAIQIF